MPKRDTTASRHPMQAYLAHVPVTTPRKPIVGNLALVAALLVMNAWKAGAILTFWALDR